VRRLRLSDSVRLIAPLFTKRPQTRADALIQNYLAKWMSAVAT
jgi:hypothetical protein